MFIPRTKPLRVTLRHGTTELAALDAWLIADVNQATRIRRKIGAQLLVTHARIYVLESGEDVIAQITRRIGREVVYSALTPVPCGKLLEELVGLAQHLMDGKWQQLVNGEVERLAVHQANSVLLGDIEAPDPDPLDEQVFHRQDAPSVSVRDSSIAAA